jgi:hypothetical protein
MFLDVFVDAFKTISEPNASSEEASRRLIYMAGKTDLFNAK